MFAIGLLLFAVLPALIVLEIMHCAYLEFRGDRIPILLYHRLISRQAVREGRIPDNEPIYTAYDDVYYIADAVKRAGSTEADKLVDALEKTDWEGTIGRIQFYGKDDPFTHSIKYGKGLITGLMLQWQDGRQVAVWPKDVAKAPIKFPSFIKVTSN